MRLSIAPLALVLALAAPAARAGHDEADHPITSVTDNHKNATYHCADRDRVTVSGNHNTVTISGECASLMVAGNHNKVTIEAVARIALSGNRNEVTYQRNLGGKAPVVRRVGSRNKATPAPHSGPQPAR